MALTPIRIPALQQSEAFVDDGGRLSRVGITRLNDTFKIISDAVNGVIDAQVAADAAQGAADQAASEAGTAQSRADDAYTLAETKVTKSAGPAWAASSGAASRAAYAAYPGQTISNPPTQAEVQALDNAVKALSQAVVAIIADLRANEALTP